MVDPAPVTATKVVQQMTNAARGGGGDEKVAVEKINGKVAPNQTNATLGRSGSSGLDASGSRLRRKTRQRDRQPRLN